MLSPSHYITYLHLSAYTVTDVGEADNTFSAMISEGDTDVTYRYKIIRRYGTLTVKHREIVLEADSVHVPLSEWDGSPISFDSYTMSGTLVEGDTITVTVQGELAEPGLCVNQIVAVSITNASGDVTANYTITYKDGTISLY